MEATLARPGRGATRGFVLAALISLIVTFQVVLAPPAHACHGMSINGPEVVAGGFTMEALASTSGNGNTGWGYVLTAPAGRTVAVTWSAIDGFSSSANLIGGPDPTSHGVGEAMRFFVSGLEAGDTVTLEVFAFTGANGDCTGPMTSRISNSRTVTIAADGPSATSGAVSGVSSTGATLAATAVVPAGATISQRGVVVGEDPAPAVGGTGVTVLAAEDAVEGAYAIVVTGLVPETTYFFRAFVQSPSGFTYGEEVSFATSAAPQVRQGPEDRVVAAAVERASGPAGPTATVVRESSVVELATTVVRTSGPRGALVVSDGDALRVTVAAAGGVTTERTVSVPEGGEIVCEICARLAAGAVIEAWIYSEPRLAAAVRVDVDAADGVCPFLRIPTGAPLDGGPAIEPGLHTLQLRMYTDQGFEVVILPFAVVGAPSTVPAGGGPPALPTSPADLLLLALLAGVVLLGLGRPVALAATSLPVSRAARRPVVALRPAPTLRHFDLLEQRVASLRRAVRDGMLDGR